MRTAAYGESVDMDTPPKTSQVTEDDFYDTLETLDLSTDTPTDLMFH